MKYFILAGLLLANLVLHAQHSLKLKIIDAETQTAVESAIIKTGRNGIIITSRDGIAIINSNDSIEVSKTGYASIKTSVNQNTIIRLEPASTFLSEVMVSGSREQQSRKEIPAAISKITSATINNTKATALYQLLNQSAGVYMVNLGNEQHTMAIRQPISYNALYLYLEDGLPIRPTGIFNHNALYEINMNAVNGIEVLKGPASSLYGSNAIGGSVNFISATPPAGSLGKISLQGDGYNYYRTDINTGFSKGKFGFYASAYAAKQKDSWQDYTNFDKYSANVKATYKLNLTTHLSFNGSYNYLNTQTPGSLDSLHFYSRSYSSNQRFTYRDVKALRASVRIDHTWTKRSSTFFTPFFRDNSTGQLPSYFIADVRDAKTKAYIKSTGQENNQSFKSYGFLAQHKVFLPLLKSELITGVYLDNSPSSYYARHLDINKDLSSNYYTGYSTSDSLLDNYKIGIFNTAAFAQYQMNPVKPLKITAGIRYDHLDYSFNNALAAGQTKYKQKEKNHYNIIAPKLGAILNSRHGFGVYSNISLGFQPPETSFLYSSRQVSKLKQATFHNYEAGVWLPILSDKLNMELAVFKMSGKNEIISVMMPDNTTQNQNAGKTAHTGLEYTFSYKPANQLNFRLGGTLTKHVYTEYSEVVNNETISFNGNQMPNAPKSIINSEATWKPAFVKGFRTAVEWQSISKYFVNSANSKFYKGYNIYNLRFGYDLNTKSIRGTSLWFNVINAGNKLYATNVTGNQYGVTYTAAAPRTLSLGISYSIAQIK